MAGIEEEPNDQNNEDPMAAAMDRMVHFVLRLKAPKTDSQNDVNGVSSKLRLAYEQLGLPPPEDPDDPLGGEEYSTKFNN